MKTSTMLPIIMLQIMMLLGAFGGLIYFANIGVASCVLIMVWANNISNNISNNMPKKI